VQVVVAHNEPRFKWHACIGSTASAVNAAVT
jgi:hypothetical protein